MYYKVKEVSVVLSWTLYYEYQNEKWFEALIF